MRSLNAAIVAAALILPAALTAPVAAQAPTGGHSHAAPHGGQNQQIGPYEVELVVKGSDVMLYVVDEKEQKVEASKFSAIALVLAKGNEQKRVELKPARDNMLSGTISFPIEGKFRAVVTLNSGSTEVGKGRYNLDVTTR